MRIELYGVKQKPGKSILTLKWNRISVSLYWFCWNMENDAKAQSRFKGSLLLVFQGASSRFPGDK